MPVFKSHTGQHRRLFQPDLSRNRQGESGGRRGADLSSGVEKWIEDSRHRRRLGFNMPEYAGVSSADRAGCGDIDAGRTPTVFSVNTAMDVRLIHWSSSSERGERRPSRPTIIKLVSPRSAQSYPKISIGSRSRHFPLPLASLSWSASQTKRGPTQSGSRRPPAQG